MIILIFSLILQSLLNNVVKWKRGKLSLTEVSIMFFFKQLIQKA